MKNIHIIIILLTVSLLISLFYINTREDFIPKTEYQESHELQTGWIPTSDELVESGGLYQLKNGIQSPTLSPDNKENPWIL